MFRKYFILSALITLGYCEVDAQTYFPPTTGNQWDTQAPESLGYCPENIDSLYNFLNQTNTKAFILLNDGKIVLEKYFDQFTLDSNWYWASAGKTLTSVLVGIAADKNLLKLTDPSSKYLGSAWTSMLKSQEDSIQIWHQLTMTTGLNDTGNVDCTDAHCLNYLAPVGSRWSYHNAPYTLLDKVIENSTGLKINQYLYQQVSVKTGIVGLYIKPDYNNVFYSKPRVMARFGHLLLNKGNWNGTQIVSETYLQSAISSSQSINPSYGYLTWLNGKSKFMVPQSQFSFNGDLINNAPKDAYAALGKNGQMIFVVPSLRMVWIRMGENPDTGNPLVSVSYSEDVWKYINRLVCSNNQVQNMPNPAMAIYPNPATTGSYVGFSSPHRGGVDLFDIMGRWIMSSNDPNGIQLPRTLKEGMFVIHFKGNANSIRINVTP